MANTSSMRRTDLFLDQARMMSLSLNVKGYSVGKARSTVPSQSPEPLSPEAKSIRTHSICGSVKRNKAHALKTVPNEFALLSQIISIQERTKRKPAHSSVTSPEPPEEQGSPVSPQRSFATVLNCSNGLELRQPVLKTTYKFFVDSGNNGVLIGRLMGARKQWQRVYTANAANFVWTQVKRPEINAALPKASAGNKHVSYVETPGGALGTEHFASLSPLDAYVPAKTRVCNRLEKNQELTSKKRLFGNLKRFYEERGVDPFTRMPLTFHISEGSADPAFPEFTQKFKESKETSGGFWIVKPGECTNRGMGIKVCGTLQEILNIIDHGKSNHTYVLQKYIENPLLYHGRKFDIRVFVLVTAFNGNLQAFLYKDGYLRTSTKAFTLKNIRNKFIHLTNDAVQQRSPEYGKSEDGNKLSYTEFQSYLAAESSVCFFTEVYPKIKALVLDSIQATHRVLDPHKRMHSFEVLGYDFMLDSACMPWLIEANTNPCLALSSEYLAHLIPTMLEDALQLTVDAMFPTTQWKPATNRFELLFNQACN